MICRWAKTIFVGLNAPRLFVVASLIAQCAVTTGCVRRRMTVRSNPPGAQVFVDDQEIGITPCSASYVYYGTRKITVMKDGYRTETKYQKFYPPWYEIPPLDFISENLVSNEIRDERLVDIDLEIDQIVPPEKLVERAQSLRDNARTGTVTPLVDQPASAPSRAPEPLRGVPGQGLPGGQPLPYEPLPGPGGISAGPGLESLPYAPPQGRP